MTKARRINWFRLNRNLHRDLGYFAIALTIVFGVSGIAVNHISDWNPNYIVEREQQKVTVTNKLSDENINQRLLTQFKISAPVRASYWESVNHYKLFFKEGGALTVDLNKHIAVYEKISERAVFKQFNKLHLNEVKFGWVILSDIYAGTLIFLAISALFMVKGKYSPWHYRKGWLVALGTILPTLYIFL